MEATINTEAAMLADCGLSEDELKAAVANALRNLAHPESGEPIYLNDVRVSVNVTSGL